jgi:hypothetical protein
MATIYFGLLAASLVDPTKLEHVRVISHSIANNQHATQYNHRPAVGDSDPTMLWGDLKALVQNAGGLIYFGGQECSLRCDAAEQDRISDVKVRPLFASAAHTSACLHCISIVSAAFCCHSY